MKLIAEKIEQLPLIAKSFLEMTRGRDVIAFYGAMGAGKTTFIAALCRELGVEDVVNSPTFTIVNEYRTKDDIAIYHFDFYRIKTIREALDIGIEEYFDNGGKCFMEWAENISPLLPDDTLEVTISVNEDGSRIFSF